MKLLTAEADLHELGAGGKLTSIDDMSPTNPLLLALAETPAAQPIEAHSIIPVEGAGDYHTGNDGVACANVAQRQAALRSVAVHFQMQEDSELR